MGKPLRVPAHQRKRLELMIAASQNWAVVKSEIDPKRIETVENKIFRLMTYERQYADLRLLMMTF